jgi:hypothetical protein
MRGRGEPGLWVLLVLWQLHHRFNCLQRFVVRLGNVVRLKNSLTAAASAARTMLHEGAL